MNLTIINGDFEITDEKMANIESRIRLALSRFATKIACVTVKLTLAANPDKEHKMCRIEVLLRPARTLTVEHTDADLQTAIDRAFAQVARSVERKLRRERGLY